MSRHQDFKEVVFVKHTKSKGPTGPVISKDQKKLMFDFEETPTVKRFGKENGKLVQSARLSKKLTQKQLANQINEKSRS